MNTAKNMRHGIVEHDRHAISRENRQDHRRIRGDKRIRLGHLLVNRERARPPVVGGDNADSGAMHLPSEHEIPEVSPIAAATRRRFSSTAPGSSPTAKLKFSDS